MELPKLLIINTKDELAAKELFGKLGLKIVHGFPFFIGEHDAVNDFVQERVKTWVSRVNRLGEAANDYPQAAHSQSHCSLSGPTYRSYFMQRSSLLHCKKL